VKLCPACGESTEDQFEACWKCGADFRATAASPAPAVPAAALAGARREARAMNDRRLGELITAGPVGLAPGMWDVLLQERQRRNERSLEPAEGYTDYEVVPWFRRDGLNSGLVFVGLFFPPALACVCGTLVTGDIYFDKRGPDGLLARWPRANRIAALVILSLQVLAIAGRFVLRHR
jgi:hypothetical protein